MARGWTVFTEEAPAHVLEDMPQGLREQMVKFLTALAVEVGGAVDVGGVPPGTAADASGHSFVLPVTDSPVLVEYLVVADIREVRVTAVIWLG